MNMSSDEEDPDCPLCMEELDIADRNFRPCSCGYQICRFCWHHIKTNLNGRCPACRRLYSEQIVEFIPVSAEEIMRLKKEKKEKDRQTREMRDPTRRQLSNVRVVQKNLVYVLGMSSKYAYADNEIFRKYGKIDKVVISKRSITTNANASVGIYVTFAKKEDACKAIEGLNGIEIDGKTIRASYGTTKYCTYYLRHMACPNPNCMYLHEPGDDVDSYNKDTVAIGNTASTSLNGSTYPNKKLATGLKPVASKAAVAESKPSASTTPRTWAPIPKVVPVSPAVAEAVPDTEEPVVTPPMQSKEISAKAKAAASPVLLKPSKSTTTKKTVVEKAKKAIKVNLEEEEKPALPPTASWAKAQPSVPLHENVITPTHFGPSLSDAVQTIQKPKQSPSLKVKKEKKSKGRMVRLEEFEEAEREAKKATHQPKDITQNEPSTEINTAQEISTQESLPSAIHDISTPMKASVGIEKDQASFDANSLKEKETRDISMESDKEIAENDEDITMNESEAKTEQPIETVKTEAASSMEKPVTGSLKTGNVEADVQQIEDLEEKQLMDADQSNQGHLNEHIALQETSKVDLNNEKRQKEDVFDVQQSTEKEAADLENVLNEKQDERTKEKVEVLACLNEEVIKAFDVAMANETLPESLEKTHGHNEDTAYSNDTQSDITSSGLSEHIPSPLVAMERLSTLVEQEILTDIIPSSRQQQPLEGNLPKETLHTFENNVSAWPESRRQPIPPPGLPVPPILPEWMSRSFDPFNGQDPSLIAARRLQHSQRMMEASGLFGMNNGFPQHRPPPPPLPNVPHFGFPPNLNENVPGFSHQPPPFPNMLARPPPPSHPHGMMRHHPPPHPHPQEMLNMSRFGGPPHHQHPHHGPIDDTNKLRAEFNAMHLNGNIDELQSRENLRALLPNVNISFNDQQKVKMEELHHSHMMHRQGMLQRQSDQESHGSTPSSHHMSPLRHGSMPPNLHFHPPPPTPDHLQGNTPPNFFRQNSFRSSNQSVSSVDGNFTQDTNPDVRTEAQNFFGEFLRKAASSNQQESLEKKEEQHEAKPENPLMFQDPAIMSVSVTGNNDTNHESNQSTMLQILGGQQPVPSSMVENQQYHIQQPRPVDARFAMNQQRMMMSDPNMDERGREQPFVNNANGNAMFMGMPPSFPPGQPNQDPMFNPNNNYMQQQQQYQQQPFLPFIPRFLEPSINTMGHIGGAPPPPNPMMRPPMMMPHQNDNFRNTGNMHHHHQQQQQQRPPGNI
ncbi:hypothetical protein RMATCC62417_02603 [Rhizopus microsporus]|nr:hypothetical protein RMATCC62417_02603 [Rhizopus microsporus]